MVMLDSSDVPEWCMPRMTICDGVADVEGALYAKEDSIGAAPSMVGPAGAHE